MGVRRGWRTEKSTARVYGRKGLPGLGKAVGSAYWRISGSRRPAARQGFSRWTGEAPDRYGALQALPVSALDSTLRAGQVAGVPIQREVNVLNAHPGLKLDRRAVASVIHALDAQADRFLGGCPQGELSIAFLTDPALAKIHADFLDDPTCTDVITFEGDPSLGTGGEVCVSADTASSYAAAHDRDFATELTLYVVHGWLHLAGYDDLRPAKKRRMRAAEARAMKILEEANLVPVFALRAAKRRKSGRR